MTKGLLLSIFAVTLILGGCAGPSSSVDKAKKVNPNALVFPEPPADPRFYYERTLRSSTNVLPEDETDKLRRALTGETLKGEGFAKPHGIAVHHGRVFVGDPVRHIVMAFDIPEQKFFMIGQDEVEGEGKLQRPLGVEVDEVGNLYVLDGNLKVIVMYDRDGHFIRNIGNPGDLYRPAGLGIDSTNHRAYAVDIGGSSSDNHRVIVYDTESGKRLSIIGKRGLGGGEFNLPRDVIVAADGSLYVVDGGNFRVQHLTKDGKFISKFGSVGRQRGQFSRPKEGAIDKDGNVYVIDAAFGNFQIFNAEGQLLMHVGTRSNVDEPAMYTMPSSVAVDEDGRVYVVDQLFRKVDIFRPAGLGEDEGYVLKGKN